MKFYEKFINQENKNGFSGELRSVFMAQFNQFLWHNLLVVFRTKNSQKSSNFTFKILNFQNFLGLCPRPHWGALKRAPQTPPPSRRECIIFLCENLIFRPPPWQNSWLRLWVHKKACNTNYKIQTNPITTKANFEQ